MLIPGPLTGHERRNARRNRRRIRQSRRRRLSNGDGLRRRLRHGRRHGRGRLGHLLYEPMPQEPDSGPHPPGRQPTAQHLPKLRPGHPAPQPLHGRRDQRTRLGDTEPQITPILPEGQQHPLHLHLFRRKLLRRSFTVSRLGGWAERVPPQFFVYR
ncbi:hypothetical protein STAN_3360 [Streptomyces sp. CBMAI 2042]|nr:hypothetical protein STAN_3360 [Streptomyces sp. CBMAI 2042]